MGYHLDVMYGRCLSIASEALPDLEDPSRPFRVGDIKVNICKPSWEVMTILVYLTESPVSDNTKYAVYMQFRDPDPDSFKGMTGWTGQGPSPVEIVAPEEDLVRLFTEIMAAVANPECWPVLCGVEQLAPFMERALMTRI